ncbi:hypothetical protein KDW_39140 [Dictyobacter vulcani]|uniref:BREX system Lon protease-like BrxL N-terminal domain-containing protein n=1 Tax=Dictyobacter vulcani TaxID=2607529 RepID=A0A5J4KRL8_9CHLR|nr:anti-phage BREX system Lon protease BrxL [Dictyobacter vulcani]GER89752.1 hypothetical protein KDW_39140 [Dictyobacter vulcani]
MTLSFEDKALQYYGEVCVNKALIRKASIGTESVPMYVSEWIVSRYLNNGQIDETARKNMRDFVNKHLPPKDQKEQLKAKLKNGGPFSFWILIVWR